MRIDSVDRADVDGEFVVTAVSLESCDGVVEKVAMLDSVTTTLFVFEIVNIALAVEDTVA